MYKLRYDEAVETVWDSLPDAARDELDRALLEACEDPYRHSVPYKAGEDEPIRRLLVLRHTVVSLLIINAPPLRRLYVRNIDHLG